MISEHQAGIPLWMDALSGNSSDKASFRETAPEAKPGRLQSLQCLTLFMANTLFLKSPKRIMALMMIMTLCLLV